MVEPGAGPLITIGLFVIAQIIIMATTIGAVRADTKVLKAQLTSMQREMEKVSNVLVTLAEQKGELNLLNDRVTLQGRRLDDLTNRVNAWMDGGRHRAST